MGADIYGREGLCAAKAGMCAVIKLTDGSEKTSVRTDSSATRGYGEEIIADARLLFLPNVSLFPNSQVTVGDIVLRVVSVRQRIDLDGRLDHYQVDLDVWAT